MTSTAAGPGEEAAGVVEKLWVVEDGVVEALWVVEGGVVEELCVVEGGVVDEFAVVEGLPAKESQPTAPATTRMASVARAATRRRRGADRCLSGSSGLPTSTK